jgi:hypothetical protein
MRKKLKSAKIEFLIKELIKELLTSEFVFINKNTESPTVACIGYFLEATIESHLNKKIVIYKYEDIRILRILIDSNTDTYFSFDEKTHLLKIKKQIKEFKKNIKLIFN